MTYGIHSSKYCRWSLFCLNAKRCAWALCIIQRSCTFSIINTEAPGRISLAVAPRLTFTNTTGLLYSVFLHSADESRWAGPHPPYLPAYLAGSKAVEGEILDPARICVEGREGNRCRAHGALSIPQGTPHKSEHNKIKIYNCSAVLNAP